uniref:Uncharacterized protein n=1 Tax=Tanacetum cinerariifolium TaxID=118510 RepID=A0A6L2PAD2_TANCI|nr:hypothetical protein [Tanacetum cinerariifolium]
MVDDGVATGKAMGEGTFGNDGETEDLYLLQKEYGDKAAAFAIPADMPGDRVSMVEPPVLAKKSDVLVRVMDIGSAHLMD